MHGLARLQEKSAAEPLADLLALGDTDSSTASDALIKIGPVAEDAVLALLKERHADTLRNACRVLKQIGTQRSLEPLKNLVLSPSASVNQAAGDAARAIAARTAE
jgi:HEAT repeat protein